MQGFRTNGSNGADQDYFLSADGLTDAEFWQLANSLK
jgi:hypothetical protein